MLINRKNGSKTTAFLFLQIPLLYKNLRTKIHQGLNKCGIIMQGNILYLIQKSANVPKTFLESIALALLTGLFSTKGIPEVDDIFFVPKACLSCNFVATSEILIEIGLGIIDENLL